MRWMALAFAAVSAWCALLAWNVFGAVPHGTDEGSYLLQARIFASGQLWTEGNLPAGLQQSLVVEAEGRRFSIYPPGWPALLALGVLAGVPWLVNPLLAGATAAALWMLARRVAGRPAAHASAVALAASPYFAFMGASQMSHMACALCILATTLALVRALENGVRPATAARAAAFAGLAAGLAFLVRPYSAMLGCAGGLLVAASATACRDPRAWTRMLAWAVPVGLACVAIHLAYNAATTGDALRSGYKLYAPDFGMLGFGEKKRASLLHNLVENLPLHSAALRSEIWGGLPLPDWALLIPAPLLLARRRSWTVLALLGAFAIQVVGYALYFFFDLFLGPRLLFEAFPWMALLAGWGAAELLRTEKHRRLAKVAFAAVALQALLAAGVRYPAMWTYYSANFAGQGRAISSIPRDFELAEPGSAGALVFVEGIMAATNFRHLNALEVGESPVIFSHGGRQAMTEMLAAFPGRTAWILQVDMAPLPGRNLYVDRYSVGDVRWKRVELDAEGKLVRAVPAEPPRSGSEKR